MLSCSIWFSVPSFWMGGGLDSRCIGRVYGADGAVPSTARHHPHRRHDLLKLFHEEDARSNNPQARLRFLPLR